MQFPLNRKRKLLLLVSFLLVAGFLTTSLVSYYVSLSSVRNQIDTHALPLTSDNIYSEIQRDLLRPVFISSLMANDTFLRDWILTGEKDIGQISKYLKEIMSQYNTFTSFFVSEKTRIYYHANGVLKKILEDEPRDVWYFRVRKMTGDYEINVDPDLANQDAMTIFINHKVFDYHGKFIGVTGVGLTINAVNRLIEEYSEKYDSNIYFTNQSGEIVLHSKTFPEQITHINQISGLAPGIDSILTRSSTQMKYSRDNEIIHLNTRMVPELNWILCVEQSEAIATQSIHGALMLNLALCLVVTAIVMMLTMFSIGAYQRVNEAQHHEIVKQHEALLEKNEELERAVLEKTRALDKNALLMREMNHRVKNNLSIIQSLLRLQSARMHDSESKIAFQESASRVRTISNIHHLLSQKADLSQIDASSYFRNLIDHICQSYEASLRDIEVRSEVGEIKLDMDLLIPFAMILTELASNAFKYAFAGEKKGQLFISISEVEEGQFELIVQDNGAGLPEGLDIREADSLGMKIITSFVDQARLQLSIDSSPGAGTRFEVVSNREPATEIA